MEPKKKVRLYLFDDDKEKHKLMRFIVNIANKEINIFNFTIGFEELGRDLIFYPESIRKALEDESGIFLLDVDLNKKLDPDGKKKLRQSTIEFKRIMSTIEKEKEKEISLSITIREAFPDELTRMVIAVGLAKNTRILNISKLGPSVTNEELLENYNIKRTGYFPQDKKSIGVANDTITSHFKHFLNDIKSFLIPTIDFVDDLWREDFSNWFKSNPGISKERFKKFSKSQKIDAALLRYQLPHDPPSRKEQIEIYKHVVKSVFPWFPSNWFSHDSIVNLHKTLKTLLGSRSCLVSGGSTPLSVGAAYILANHIIMSKLSKHEEAAQRNNRSEELIESWENQSRSSLPILFVQNNIMAQKTVMALYELFERLIFKDDYKVSVDYIRLVKDGARLEIGLPWMDKDKIKFFTECLMEQKSECEIGQTVLAFEQFLQLSIIGKKTCGYPLIFYFGGEQSYYLRIDGRSI